MTPQDAIEIIEEGTTIEQEYIEAFQTLIDSGLVWYLQGSYGRTAKHLIESGQCSL